MPKPHPGSLRCAARRVMVFAGVVGWLTSSILTAAAQSGLFAPERESGWQEKPLARAPRMMVVAANPLAVTAGLDMLRAGGSAVDAAVAVQLVLGLVEPQSSGLGGGAFLLHWESASRRMIAYDGREVAPSAARPDRFLVKGRPMPFRVAVKSPLSIGIPGTVALLADTHKRHGRLPWAKLFEPAIKLADEGFAVSPRLAGLLAASPPTSFDGAARAYFYDKSGIPWRAGHMLRNLAYAATLRALAQGGAPAFYERAIADAVQQAAAVTPAEKGALTRADLAAYKVVVREPVCVPYRGNRFCSMGPPSSGAHTIGQALTLLEPFDLGTGPGAAMAPSALHLIGEALKLAFADRNRYLADPAFVAPPQGLLDPQYLADRRQLLFPHRPLDRIHAGTPPGSERQALGPDATIEASGTSHVSIIDTSGNVVSMTTTIEAAFGSGRMASGFLLNNELTDFSFSPTSRGRPVANRVEAGKRPRSSMSPTIVLGADGNPFIVVGSAGGSRIIPYVVKALVALIDWKLDASQALALPNIGSRPQGFELEWPQRGGWSGMATPSGAFGVLTTALNLKPYGNAILLDAQTSGTHVIVRRPGGMLEGAADPRREGLAAGD